MAKWYRQNASYREIQEDDNDDDAVESRGGNTGLPFGLCKKYGIATYPSWTPRDAWNALKGIGIYPPWTEKGKDQYTSEDSDGDNAAAEKEHISAHKKAIYDKINNKLSKFPKEYRERLSESLENLDENELMAISATFDNANYRKGSGSYLPGANELSVPSDKISSVDKELGYAFGATTFYHEYGHYLAHKLAAKMAGEREGRDENGWLISDFNALPEFQAVFAEDARNLMELAASEAGLTKPISMDRISREQAQAFYSMLHKVSEKDLAKMKEPKRPRESDYTYDRRERINFYTRWGYSPAEAEQKADNFIASQKEAYQRALKEYNEALVKWETYADKVPAAQAMNERAGLLSDFIAGATGGRINPYESGYWGHQKSYWQGKRVYGTKMPGTRNGVETWAEYVSFKMTKDKKGLAMFKEYLPKTFAKYEEIYPKMGGLLNEGK